MSLLEPPRDLRHAQRAGHRRADRVLKRALVADLQEDPRTRGERIRIDVIQHVVVLGGVVSTTAAKDVARSHAWAMTGVRDVSDQLVVAARLD